MDINHLEDALFEYVEQFKVLLSQEIWENILLDCTKNELFVLMLLYRGAEVNMTQIADYLNVPLNTATGIVARMEKKDMVQRIRSSEDKRVVTIVFTDFGRQQIHSILGAFMEYGQRIVASLSVEEIALIGNLISKIIAVLQETKIKKDASMNKVRKIIIE